MSLARTRAFSVRRCSTCRRTSVLSFSFPILVLFLLLLLRKLSFFISHKRLFEDLPPSVPLSHLVWSNGSSWTTYGIPSGHVAPEQSTRGSSSIAPLGTSGTATQSPPHWLQDFIELNQNKSVPFIRYVCSQSGGCGGAGDRISGILQAFYMAMCTNRRLQIAWTSPSPLDRYLIPNHIDWREHKLGSASHQVTLINVIDQPDSLYLTDPSNLPEGDIDLQINTWLGESVLLEKYSCLRNVGISEADASSQALLYRTAFWTLFRWAPAVEKASRSFRKSHKLLDQDYLALHIRTGRGVTFQDPLTESNNEDAWRLYLQCAQMIRRMHWQMQDQGRDDESRLPIYVAADTLDAKLLLQQLDDSVVVSSPDVEVYHIDRTNVAAIPTGDAAERALLQVWVDLKLLMDSACLVMSTGMKHGFPSKFSRMARWLSDAQPRCAILWHDCHDPRSVKEAVEHWQG